MLTHDQEVQAILDIAATDEPSRIYAADGIHAVRELEGARLIEEAKLRPDVTAQYHYVQLRNAEKAMRDAGDRWEDLARFALDRTGALTGNVLDVLVHGGGPKKEETVDYNGKIDRAQHDRAARTALLGFMEREPESLHAIGSACLLLRDTLADTEMIVPKQRQDVRKALGLLWLSLDDAEIDLKDHSYDQDSLTRMIVSCNEALRIHEGSSILLIDHLFHAALEG